MLNATIELAIGKIIQNLPFLPSYAHWALLVHYENQKFLYQITRREDINLTPICSIVEIKSTIVIGEDINHVISQVKFEKEYKTFSLGYTLNDLTIQKMEEIFEKRTKSMFFCPYSREIEYYNPLDNNCQDLFQNLIKDLIEEGFLSLDTFKDFKVFSSYHKIIPFGGWLKELN